jgi:hypothetical protein
MPNFLFIEGDYISIESFVSSVAPASNFTNINTEYNVLSLFGL